MKQLAEKYIRYFFNFMHLQMNLLFMFVVLVVALNITICNVERYLLTITKLALTFIDYTFMRFVSV